MNPRKINYQRIITYVCFMILISLFTGCQNVSKRGVAKANYEFPENEMGTLAKTWFQAVNQNELELLKDNFDDDYMFEFLTLLQSHTERVGGITPMMNSYCTEDRISIYAKENKGLWVKVNISAKNGIIYSMDIKKSHEPIDNSQLDNLASENRDQIISDLIENIKTNYVIPEQADKIALQVKRNQELGKYNNINQGDFLAVELTEDLRLISNDVHLEIIPPTMRNAYLNRFAGEDSNDNGSEVENVITSRIIENNIGLVTLKRFSGTKSVLEKTDLIFDSLASTQSIIIDLRNSGGGDEVHVLHLLSYFFKEKIKVASSFNRVTGEEKISYTTPNELSKIYSQKPLLILTSKKTISAGESLAYFLQFENRASVIGEVTAGAGYLVDAFELPHGFYFVCSIAPSFDPDGNIGWEGSGVKPNIPTESENALQKALANLDSIQ